MRKLALFTLGLTMAVMVAGCASASSSGSKSSGSGGAAGAPGAPAQAGQASGGSSQANAITSDRMIVRNATLALTVTSVQESVALATGVAERARGYVTNVDYKYQMIQPPPLTKAQEQAGAVLPPPTEQAIATMGVRVPSFSYEAVMTDLRALASRVDKENSTAKDVTEEYVDLDSRRRNLEATEAQFLELMKRAQTVDEIIKVQGQLTDVRGQIERLKGQLQVLERTSDMASISLTLTPPPPAITPPPAPVTLFEWAPARAVAESWAVSISGLQGVTMFMIRTVVLLWWVILLFAGGAFMAHRWRQTAEIVRRRM